jgi:hypothetical protein
MRSAPADGGCDVVATVCIGHSSNLLTGFMGRVGHGCSFALFAIYSSGLEKWNPLYIADQ